MSGIPSFLQPVQSVSLTGPITIGGPSAPSPVGGAPVSTQLSFSMQSQTETNWCWAATSTSVSLFFNASSGWIQCDVANQAWSRTDCCGSGSSGPCNKPWYLDKALSITGNLDRMTSHAESFSTIQGEVKASRPLCMRVGWAGGGGHFLAIYGWLVGASGTQYCRTDDPIYGRDRVIFGKLQTSYRSSGTWTHSYFVQAVHAASGGAVTMDINAVDPTSIGA